MIVEIRTYTTLPGKWREYLSLYEAEGLQIQKRVLGRMLGYYRTETGALNQIVHMWGYTDFNERTFRRAQLLGNSCFQAYFKRMLPLLQSQESKIVVPAPFFTPCWQD